MCRHSVVLCNLPVFWNLETTMVIAMGRWRTRATHVRNRRRVARNGVRYLWAFDGFSPDQQVFYQFCPDSTSRYFCGDNGGDDAPPEKSN
jgi:hypothetical protein